MSRFNGLIEAAFPAPIARFQFLRWLHCVRSNYFITNLSLRWAMGNGIWDMGYGDGIWNGMRWGVANNFLIKI